MENMFNNILNLLLQDIIEICYKYIDKKDCKIYFYCFLDDSVYYGNYFYRVDNEYFKKEEVQVVDTSVKRRIKYANDIQESINLLLGTSIICEHKGPFEIKVYADKNNIVNVDLVKSSFVEGSVSRRFEEWFLECKNDGEA